MELEQSKRGNSFLDRRLGGMSPSLSNQHTESALAAAVRRENIHLPLLQRLITTSRKRIEH